MDPKNPHRYVGQGNTLQYNVGATYSGLTESPWPDFYGSYDDLRSDAIAFPNTDEAKMKQAMLL